MVLESATVVRPIGDVVFRELNWSVCEDETWAVVGPVGSGKTSLAETIVGQLPVRTGAISWPFLDRFRGDGASINRPSDAIRYVSFKEQSYLFSYGRHYYQQRFNFIEPQDDLMLEDFLRAETSAAPEVFAATIQRLGIADLLTLSLIKLSNGQIRRARIARALLSSPEWLILDEPFMGLDTSGREELLALLAGVREHCGLLIITRPDAIPQWATHVLELQAGTVRWQGMRQEFVEQRMQPASSRGHSPQDEGSPPRSKVNAVSSRLPLSEPVIELRDVNVQYDTRQILRNVSWTIRPGERWALLGPNGSGKTTLLSLMCGDHPQAYSSDIRLFGQQRGSGESIWDIKRRIGLVSPELHLYYSEPLTAAQTAATGYFDVLAYRPTNAEQDKTINDLFDYFGIARLAKRLFAQLSTGEQRLVLLVRALVKAPPVLILDEPFQGFDSLAISRAQVWLDRNLRPDQTLIFVTHIPAEIPQSVDRRIYLNEGRVVE
ncbi:MAG: ATP-binding cassette domain-containing protein [Gemmataceae bacterium]